MLPDSSIGGIGGIGANGGTTGTSGTPTGRRRESKSELYGDYAPSVDPALLQSLSQRAGSVLAKGTILKLEHYQSNDLTGAAQPTHYPSTMSPPMPTHSHHTLPPQPTLWMFGAPNYRRAAATTHIYGVAQPDHAGLLTINRLLCNTTGCGPLWCNTREEPIIYIAGRPFVLRDEAAPLKNVDAFQGISGLRLEQMELRLREDVVEEGRANGGLVVVHEERGGGVVVPCLLYCDADSVKTTRQLFDELQQRQDSQSTRYTRLPISHTQSPFDAFIDDLYAVFAGIGLGTPVVFTCGMGVGRATYAMILGTLIRRWQCMAAGHPDPIAPTPEPEGDPAKLTLRLVYVLEQALGTTMGESAVQWALRRRNLLDNLRAALLGDYKSIVDLTRSLDHGQRNKAVVDAVIDQCSQCLNLREQILLYRLKGITPNDDGSFLDLALSYLERYFSLIVLNSFFASASAVSASQSPSQSPSQSQSQSEKFGGWIRKRAEIWNMFVQLRRHHNKLRAFRPIDDLSAVSSVSSAAVAMAPGVVDAAVIKARQGTILGPNNILKLDHWGTSEEAVEGAPNFRKISPSWPVYVTAQPTASGLHRLKSAHLQAGATVVWVNVREEPIVYINGEPYVLRDQWNTLRNIKTYSGIAADRVEQMEDKLVEDVVAEAHGQYNDRILLHSEVSGALIPLWEGVESAQAVCTPKQLFAGHERISYHRVPVTAEQPPEPADFDHITRIIFESGAHRTATPTALVFNCQMGLTRSTTCAVIAVQILEALGGGPHPTGTPFHPPPPDATLHYALVNAALRGMRAGVAAKRHLDAIVDLAGDKVNLRHAIEELRSGASTARKSVVALKRYCLLLLFEGYLSAHASRQDGKRTFQEWLTDHPEYVKLMTDQDRKPAIDMLLVDTPNRTMAALDDVVHVVHDRHGSVLAPMTILKYDHFPGCQRPSLPERIDGAPNFRQVHLKAATGDHRVSVYGVAMPTEPAIDRVLSRIASQTDTLWVCLREEPVVYVNGRPFVLRQVKDPITNLEMTGIPSRRVESMEGRLKEDVLQESMGTGRVLLHEEAEDGSGVVAVWEPVGSAESVQTMSDLYCKPAISSKCTFKRVAITDEQSPIPTVFDQLSGLIMAALDGGVGAFVFNCQMGRGRTTTGMVIASMLVHQRAGVFDLCGYGSPPLGFVSGGSSALVYSSSSSGPVPTVPQVQPIVPIVQPMVHLQEHPNASMLMGNYKLIVKLVAVLAHGRRAKTLADAAIDACQHLQNLRECIYDQRQQQMERAVNYLLRYFYLVAFAGYLLDLSGGGDGGGGFQRWLAERREIGNLVADPHSILLE